MPMVGLQQGARLGGSRSERSVQRARPQGRSPVSSLSRCNDLLAKRERWSPPPTGSRRTTSASWRRPPPKPRPPSSKASRFGGPNSSARSSASSGRPRSGRRPLASRRKRRASKPLRKRRSSRGSQGLRRSAAAGEARRGFQSSARRPAAQGSPALTAGCEQVRLAFADVLCEPGERIRHVYFPADSFISLAAPVEGRATLEVGLIGNEGMLGIPLILGIDVSAQRALVRGSGAALRMTAASFHRELAGARHCSAGSTATSTP